MTPQQFAIAAFLAKMSEVRTDIARAVLLDNKTQAVAVAPYGYTRQAAAGPVRAIKRHWAAFEAARRIEQTDAGLGAKDDA